MTTPKPPAALPATVYVRRQTTTTEPTTYHLVVSESIDWFEDGEVVGIYDLRDTRTVSVQVFRELK